MKKLFFISFSILLLLSFLGYGFFIKKSVNDKEHNNIDNSVDLKDRNREESSNWEKITDYIYIDKDSIKKEKYSISAWFKMYVRDEYVNKVKVNDIPVYYRLIKYDASCQDSILCLERMKEYDKNNNILSDELNKHNICAGSDGGPNGEIAFEALCKYEKGEE